MKVGILTFHFSDNFGALFQAYALRKWFINQGYDTEFINYHPDYVEHGGTFLLNNIFSKRNLKILYLRLINLKQNIFGNKQQKANFQLFRQNHLKVYGPTFKNLNDLQRAKLNYDLLVCGSDQIWSPSDQFGLDPVYFLNFKTNNGNVRKISYAPSFGRDFLDLAYNNQLKEFFLQIDGISIREQSGVSIIKNITGTSPECVPDPTLLIPDYSDIIYPYPIKNDSYVFCYYLRSRILIGDIAESIAQNLTADLISPFNPHRRWKEIGKTVYPCPRQWLFLLKNSRFVVTNSFHGTALSILFNKPFVTVGLQSSKSSFNARALNLLNLVGLKSRYIENYNHKQIDDIITSTIDWDSVNERVKELRLHGENYLFNQINLVSR